ncbi:MAG TPA: hypothetical protein VNX68_15705 [Nitrosopumilaceae archaeon]|jgi:hypothetical protein|nr:hypothetical protein [Nitrosopumilaceae archaeon]
MPEKTYEERIVIALEAIAASLKKFTEEGITIYYHENGEEQKN